MKRTISETHILCTYLKPFEQLEVQNGTLRHIEQRIVAEELTADKVESSPQMGESRGMGEVVAGLSTTFSVQVREVPPDSLQQIR